MRPDVWATVDKMVKPVPDSRPEKAPDVIMWDYTKQSLHAGKGADIANNDHVDGSV